MPLRKQISDSALDVLKASVLDAVVAVDEQGNVVAWNDSAVSTFGWTEAEALGRPLGELIIPAAQRNPHDEGMARYISTGFATVVGRRIEASAIDRHGRAFPVELSIMRAPEGGSAAFIGFIRDISERSAAQARLAVSEESLRLATDAAEVGTWDLDLITDTLTWSDRTKAMFGISADATCSMADFYNGLHPEDVSVTREAFASATDADIRATYDVEYRTIGKEDQKVRWVAAKGKGLFDADGRCVRAVGTAIDITARKAADVRQAVLREFTGFLGRSDPEAALYPACELLGRHFGVSRVGFGRMDPQDDVISYTVCWTDAQVPPLLGEYPAHAFGPQIMTRLSAGETVVVDDLFADLISREAVTRQTASDVDTRAILVVPFLRGGRLRTIVYLNAREPRQWTMDEVSFMQTVAERTRQLIDKAEAEAALRETAERYRLAAKATNEPIWDWNLVSNHVQWNDALYDLFGFDPAKVQPTGDWWVEHIVPEDRQRISDSIHAAIEGTQEHWSEEYRFLNADGVGVPIVDRGYVLRDEQGRALRMIGAMFDLTERYRAEKLLKDANEHLEDRVRAAISEREEIEQALRQSQKMEAVGQLTGGIAHDFNNMLAVVMGSLDLLGRRINATDPRSRLYVENAMEGAKRAATLTQRLLAFSRQQPLQPEPLDVNRLVAGMSDLLRHSLGGHVQLEAVLAGGLWRTHADPNQLENVLINLAVNARDAMPEGGRLTIETQNAHLDDRYGAANVGVAPGQYVMIAVTDSGTGMSDETIARAFDPFFTTKEVGKGTGLGLSQVYGFVKQSGGNVKIYSEPGVGTSVKIYLPRLMGTVEDVEVVANPSDIPLGEEQEVILVVEDEPFVRQFSVAALTELGYRVLEADGAAAALSLLDANPDVSLLFTDVVMPEVNGAKLAAEVKLRRPDIRILFTTGYTRNAVVHNGTLDPGVQLIGKPFTIDDLAAKVREVLDA